MFKLNKANLCKELVSAKSNSERGKLQHCYCIGGNMGEKITSGESSILNKLGQNLGTITRGQVHHADIWGWRVGCYKNKIMCNTIPAS